MVLEALVVNAPRVSSRQQRDPAHLIAPYHHCDDKRRCVFRLWICGRAKSHFPRGYLSILLNRGRQGVRSRRALIRCERHDITRRTRAASCRLSSLPSEAMSDAELISRRRLARRHGCGRSSVNRQPSGAIVGDTASEAVKRRALGKVVHVTNGEHVAVIAACEA